jgi:hypothetical protein
MISLKRVYAVPIDTAYDCLRYVLEDIQTHYEWHGHTISLIEVHGEKPPRFDTQDTMQELQNSNFVGTTERRIVKIIPKPFTTERPYVDFLRPHWSNTHQVILIAGMKDLNKMLEEHRAQLNKIEPFPEEIPLIGMRPVVWDREKGEFREL